MGYAVYHQGSVIYGVGHTREAAIKEALYWLNDGANFHGDGDGKYLAEDILDYWDGDGDGIYAIPCTEGIIKLVEAVGGGIAYDIADGIMGTVD